MHYGRGETMNKRKIKKKRSDIIFDTVVYSFLIFLCIAIIIPFMQIITISLSYQADLNKPGFHLIPTNISWDGYRAVFKNKMLWNAYFNTIIRVSLGTFLNVFFTVLAAYPLSKKYLPNRTLWTGLIVFTMYFSGGLMPTYFLIRDLHMLNNMSCLIVPGLISAFNLIIVRNFFMALPESVEESAKIDGAKDLTILFRIVLPLSKPIIATIALWCGVGHWNAWFDCMIYIRDKNQWVLQMLLRNIIIEGNVSEEIEKTTGSIPPISPDTLKMATLIISIVPIMCVYPFVQKYFVKGVMIGSLKG